MSSADVDELRRHPRTLAIGWLLFLGVACASATLWVWDGRGSRELTFEQLLTIVGRDPNPDAAIERLRAKTQEAIRAIRQHRDSAERTGALARNALAHISKEVSK